MDLYYIVFFVFSVLLVNMAGGLKATYYYLLVVLVGVLLVRWQDINGVIAQLTGPASSNSSSTKGGIH